MDGMERNGWNGRDGMEWMEWNGTPGTVEWINGMEGWTGLALKLEAHRLRRSAWRLGLQSLNPIRAIPAART